MSGHPDETLFEQVLGKLSGKISVKKQLRRAAEMPPCDFQRERQKIAGKVRMPLAALDHAVKKLRHALIVDMGEGEEDTRPTALTLLLAIAEGVDLVLESGVDGLQAAAYALIPRDGHTELHEVRSDLFQKWLRRELFQRHAMVASREAMNMAVETIAAKALDEPQREVFLRTGRVGDAIYIDATNNGWEVIKVTPSGVETTDNSEVCFRRASRACPLPSVAAVSYSSMSGEGINLLRKYVNVRRGEEDFVLIVAWLLSALSGRGPYPVLVLSGAPGAAKSTLARVLRALVDPNQTPLRSLQPKEHDTFVSAQHNHVMAFDNVDFLTPAQSDTICKLATGGGYDQRELYTNKGELALDACRPVIITSIRDVAERGDLASRTFAIELPDIPETAYKTEAGFWAEFEKDAPIILESLLYGLATGLCRAAGVKVEALGRMADVALWGAACETAFWPDDAGIVARALKSNRARSAAIVVSGDLVANAIVAMSAFQDRPIAGRVNGLLVKPAEYFFEGTATELLSKLEVSEADRRSRAFPRGANALSARLRQLKSALATRGIRVEFDREGHEGGRIIRLSVIPHAAPEGSSASSATENSQENQALAPDDPSGKIVSMAPKRDLKTGKERKAADDADGADDDRGTSMGEPDFFSIFPTITRRGLTRE